MSGEKQEFWKALDRLAAQKVGPTGPDDPNYYPVEAVGVQCQGFLATAGVVRAKGKNKRTWIWLTGEQQATLLRDVPRSREFQFDRRESSITSGYPRFMLKYTENDAGRGFKGLNSGEDKWIDAAELLFCAEEALNVSVKEQKWKDIPGRSKALLALLRRALRLEDVNVTTASDMDAFLRKVK